MLLRSTTASISRSASGFVCPPAAVPASAPDTGPGQVPPVLLRAGRTRVRFCFIGSHRGLLSYSRVSRSALRPARAELLWPLLTSGDPSQRLSTPVAQGKPPDLPGYYALTFTLMPVGSTSRRSVQVLGFAVYWPAHPAVPPLSASCSSGQRFAYGFLQIPPRDGHPCRSANTSPCRVCRGLSPPSECALPGAPHKSPAHGAGLACLSVESTAMKTLASEPRYPWRASIPGSPGTRPRFPRRRRSG